MKMPAVFPFGVLLLLLGCVQCTERIFSEDNLVIKTYEPDLEKIDDSLFSCTLCKKILQRLLNSIGKQLSKNSVDAALSKACQRYKVIRAPCQKLVNKYKAKLIRAIMSAKNAPEACKQLRLCK